MPDGEHKRLMLQALELEARGQRLLLDRRDDQGAALMLEAAQLYRESWDSAPPESYGRLIGLMKAAIIGGDADDAAAFTRGQIPDPPSSAAAAYALAMALLVAGDDLAAASATTVMQGSSPAFSRTADAIAALARRDKPSYTQAIAEIVEDFEGRDVHLTGVAIADTALMLERLAEPRGLTARIDSPLLPPVD